MKSSLKTKRGKVPESDGITGPSTIDRSAGTESGFSRFHDQKEGEEVRSCFRDLAELLDRPSADPDESGPEGPANAVLSKSSFLRRVIG
jgi:hypothetical protein